jgi:hypothetical protein
MRPISAKSAPTMSLLTVAFSRTMSSHLPALTIIHMGWGLALMRARASGSARRFMTSSIPPACAHFGRMAAISVWFQSCGITSKAMSTSWRRAISIISSVWFIA